jgi:anti-anti-sigma factor
MTTFELETREHPESHLRLVEVSGEVDFTNTHDLEARLDEVPEDVTLVLDLNRVLFADSAAIHTLFRIARARGRDRFGLVLEPTAAITRTLEITGLPRVVPVRTSADEVLAAVTAASR